MPASLTRAKFLQGFALALTPSEPATFDVTLAGRTKKASLAALRVQLFSRSLPLAAGARPLLVKPARKGVGRVRKPVKVTLTVVATDAAGNRASDLRTITVKPDPRRKRKRG